MARKKKKNILSKILTLLIFIFAFLIFLVGYSIFSKQDEEKITANPQKVKAEEINNKGFDNIANLVGHVRKKMGVLENLHTQYIKDDGIHIYIGIDRQKVDLTYANAILQQNLLDYGAEIITGWESNTGRSQQLEVIDKKDGKKYFIRVYYAEKEKYDDSAPKLALIVDDFGNISKKLTDEFCKKLDPAVTFAILPGKKRSKYSMQKAIESGHEAMIHMPMEPGSYPKNDPGDNAIFVDMSEKEIKKRVNEYIEELPLCLGANNHMGSLVTSDEQIISYVLEVVKEHDLYFVDSRTTGSSEAYKVAQKLGIPSFERNLFLDDPDASKDTRDKRIATIKEYFAKRQRTVVIAHCFSQEHLENIHLFVEEAKEIGFEIVPVSAFYKNDLPLIR